MMRNDKKYIARRLASFVTFLLIGVVQTCFIPSSHATPQAAVLSAGIQHPTSYHLHQSFIKEVNLNDKKAEKLGEFYLLTMHRDPQHLEVYEKLPQGGFGRLLRYRGWVGGKGWVDFEFVFEDEENRITILDHRKGKFLRVTFREKQKENSWLFPTYLAKDFVEGWMAPSPQSKKWAAFGFHTLLRIHPEIHRIFSQTQGLNQEMVWSRCRGRSPPSGGERS